MAIIVTTTDDVVDSGDDFLSLREAVAQANGTAATDTIRFAAEIEGQTLTLTAGELVLREDVTIDGDQTMTASRSRSAVPMRSKSCGPAAAEPTSRSGTWL